MDKIARRCAKPVTLDDVLEEIRRRMGEGVLSRTYLPPGADRAYIRGYYDALEHLLYDIKDGRI